MEISQENVAKFIDVYHHYEEGPEKMFWPVIDKIADNKDQASHLKDQWHSKSKGFGQFFLNLSWRKKIKLLSIFDLADSADLSFLVKKYNHPHDEIFDKPEGFSMVASELLMYFENHGINPWPQLGITEEILPEMKQRFGNSYNWAEFYFKNPQILINHVNVLKEMYA